MSAPVKTAVAAGDNELRFIQVPVRASDDNHELHELISLYNQVSAVYRVCEDFSSSACDIFNLPVELQKSVGQLGDCFNQVMVLAPGILSQLFGLFAGSADCSHIDSCSVEDAVTSDDTVTGSGGVGCAPVPTPPDSLAHAVSALLVANQAWRKVFELRDAQLAARDAELAHLREHLAQVVDSPDYVVAAIDQYSKVARDCPYINPEAKAGIAAAILAAIKAKAKERPAEPAPASRPVDLERLTDIIVLELHSSYLFGLDADAPSATIRAVAEGIAEKIKTDLEQPEVEQ